MSAALHLETLQRAVRDLPGTGQSAGRQAALAAFARRGFPAPREEDWKYTDLGPAIDISNGWLAAGAPVDEPDLDAIRRVQSAIDAHWLVLANGVLVEACSSALTLPGLAVEPSAMTDSPIGEPLTDLNAALARDALALRIGRRYADDKPIGLLIADNGSATPMVSQARLALHLEAGASAGLVEYHVSSGTQRHYSNTVIDLGLAAGAACRYVRLQERSLEHSQTTRLAARLDADARLDYFGVDLGGALTRNDLTVDLVGANATAVLNGLYLAGSGQHVDNHTRTDHRVGPARSQQEYRGVLAGRCRAVWNGKAIVHAGADGTDAQQANHNLLLTEHAEIDAKPELEIYADDVKCAHGTTVGQLDERALFYLRSRGLDRQDARRVLTRAFAATVVNALPIEALRELVAAKVEARLGVIDAGSAT